jgi:hypothetical protein
MQRGWANTQGRASGLWATCQRRGRAQGPAQGRTSGLWATMVSRSRPRGLWALVIVIVVMGSLIKYIGDERDPESNI